MADVHYAVVVHPDEDGGYWTEVPGLPGTGSQGETVEEAIANTREAIMLMLEYLRGRGDAVPAGDVVVDVTVPVP